MYIFSKVGNPGQYLHHQPTRPCLLMSALKKKNPKNSSVLAGKGEWSEQEVSNTVQNGTKANETQTAGRL